MASEGSNLIQSVCGCCDFTNRALIEAVTLGHLDYMKAAIEAGVKFVIVTLSTMKTTVELAKHHWSLLQNVKCGNAK